MKERKIPERMCVACRQMKPKPDLLRIVKTPEGKVMPDDTGKVNGRGVYLCKCRECLARAQKNKGFYKAYGFNLDGELVAALEKLIEQQN